MPENVAAAPEPTPEVWDVQAWEDKRGTSPFGDWFADCDEYTQAVVDAVIDKVLRPLGMDVCATEWGKPLGDGLYEVRIRRSLHAIRTWGQSDPSSAATGEDETVLLRIFCTFHGAKVVLLFQGYDKGDDPSERRQNREIATARKHLKAWKAELAAAAKEAKRVPRR